MTSKKPPLGVMPEYLWRDTHPEPTVLDLLRRYRDVADAIHRYREAGEPVPLAWRLETGVTKLVWGACR